MSVQSRRFVRAICVVLCLLAVCPNSLCQKAKKIQVFVKHQGEDAVGIQVAYAIRESIRRSEGYTLGDDGADTVIELVTAQTGPGVSVASLVIIKKGSSPVCNFNLAHLVYSIGSQRSKEMGDDIVATLDRQVNEFNFLYTKQ